MRGTLAERFAAKVDVNGPVPVHRPELGPCHVWTAHKDKNGYGRIGLNTAEGPTKASRVAFFLAHGRWPKPCALHECDNPGCVKALPDKHGPAHVVEGTQKKNMEDCAARGRSAAQVHPERVARGDRSGARTHPESRPRGEKQWKAKLTDEQVREIRERYATGGVSQQTLADEHGVTQMSVSFIVRGKTWKHL